MINTFYNQKMEAILSLFNCDDMKQRQLLFCRQASLLRDVRFVFLDNDKSNIDSTFDEIALQENESMYEKYHLYGIGDYLKAFIIDYKHAVPGIPTEFKAAKTVYLDLNILIDLYKLLANKSARIDNVRFKNFLTYLKQNAFEINIDHAVLERVATLDGTSSELTSELKDMVEYFVRFQKLSIGDFDVNHAELSTDEISNIDDYLKERIECNSKDFNDYIAICCLIEKAYLIKKEPSYKSGKQRVDALIEYSLFELHLNLENEIYMLSKYLCNEQCVSKFFSKLDRKSKIVENIRNTAWDFYQLRLIEIEFARQNLSDYNSIIFPYYATRDQGLSIIIEQNPVCGIALVDNRSIPFHQYDGLKNYVVKKNYYEIVERIGTPQNRAKESKNTDYSAIRQNLEKYICDLSM